MKHLFLIISVGAILFSYNSCSKDKTPPPADCVVADSLNTYTKSVKVIFDNNCASGGCHDANGVSGVRLNSYENSLAAARQANSRLICVIDGSCTPTMPPGQQMDDSLINKIKAWRDNCYAE